MWISPLQENRRYINQNTATALKIIYPVQQNRIITSIQIYSITSLKRNIVDYTRWSVSERHTAKVISSWVALPRCPMAPFAASAKNNCLFYERKCGWWKLHNYKRYSLHSHPEVKNSNHGKVKDCRFSMPYRVALWPNQAPSPEAK
jgi:hypothetical protein